MRYGGHQTFFIREGWIPKGLDFLNNSPEKLSDDHAADYLGVGRNMAQALNHWLLATGLAKKEQENGKKKGGLLHPTKMAEQLFYFDPYCLDLGTWWILHINLIHNPGYAATWNWFFSDFLRDRFEKSVALDALQRWEQLQKGNAPSTTTLDRDLLVFLSSYSRVIPPPHKDPEEEIDCPLRDLELLTYFKTSGYYQLRKTRRKIPAEIFLYALNLSLAEEERSSRNGWTDKKFLDVIRLPLGPAQVFLFGNEDLYEYLADLEQSEAEKTLRIETLAGERILSFRVSPDPETWAFQYWRKEAGKA